MVFAERHWVYWDMSSKLQPSFHLGLVLTSRQCKASRSARRERFGPSHVFLGHVHSPLHARGCLDSWDYVCDFLGSLWTSHSPVFSFEYSGQPLVDPTGTAASGVCIIKSSLIIFSKCPKDDSCLHRANKDKPWNGYEMSVLANVDRSLGIRLLGELQICLAPNGGGPASSFHGLVTRLSVVKAITKMENEEWE